MTLAQLYYIVHTTIMLTYIKCELALLISILRGEHANEHSILLTRFQMIKIAFAKIVYSSQVFILLNLGDY